MVFDAYPIFLDEVLLSLRLAVEQFRRRSSCVRERLEVVFSFTRPIEDGRRTDMITGSRGRGVVGGRAAVLLRKPLKKSAIYYYLIIYYLIIYFLFYLFYLFIYFIYFIYFILFIFYFILFYFNFKFIFV